MKKRLIQVVTLFCICLFISSAGAAEAEKSKNWEFNLAPFYLWMANLSGDMTVKGPGGGQPVDIGFSDIWDNLEGIFTVHFEGIHKNNWGFIFNLDYLNLGSSGTTPLGPIDVDFKETIAGLDMFYRTETGSHTFDYLLGLRYTDVDAEANFTNLSRTGSGEDNWMDMIIGMRYLYQMSEKWKLSLRGDLGGGGSDFTYQALGIVNYQPWKNVSVFGGYRLLSTDYSQGSGINEFKYDIDMHGPILGVNFNW